VVPRVFYPGTLCPENWPNVAIDRATLRKKSVCGC